MAAIVQIITYTGAEPGTKRVILSQRYNTAIPTLVDPGLATPNNVPPAGQIYRSCWLFTGAEIIGGTYSQLTNWRWGTPGSIKTDWGLGSSGGKVQVALKDGSTDPGLPITEYKQATGVPGLYGYDIKENTGGNGHGIPYYYDEVIACADADLYDTDNPLVFDTAVYTPASPVKITKLVPQQLVLYPDSEFGEKSELNNFIRWQEI